MASSLRALRRALPARHFSGAATGGKAGAATSPAAGFDAAYAASMDDPVTFWEKAAAGIHWERPFSRVLSNEPGKYYSWYDGGLTNASYNALDRHVSAGRGNQAAIIYDSPVTGVKQVWTYAQLLSEVETAAGLLRDLGVKKGDGVMIYFPAVPQVLVAVMACERIGAISSTVFGGFASHELAVRLDDFKPKVILAGSVGMEGAAKKIAYKPLIDGALAQSRVRSVQNVVMLQRPEGPAALTDGYLDWEVAMARIRSKGLQADPEWVESSHPQYCLYTSGTTSLPKGVVRDTGGHAVALTWAASNVYDINAGDRWWAASDMAWVVGSSWICWGPLLAGATTTLYEGKPVGTPDAGAFWRVCSEWGIKAMFTAPTAIRAVKKEDPQAACKAAYPMPNFKTLFLAGERSDPDTIQWAERALSVPVLDNWWMTELGWPAIAYSRGLGYPPVRYGSAGKCVPGWNLHVLDPQLATGASAETFQVLAQHVPDKAAEGPLHDASASGGLPATHHHNLHAAPVLKEARAGELGPLVIRLPMPPGSLTGLLHAEGRFKKGYLDNYPGYFDTGDAAYEDEDGYIHIMARADDVINVAAHRLSTGTMEAVISAHPAVAECAVIGPADELKGQVPWGVVVLKRGYESADLNTISAEIVKRVRDEVGPVAAFHTVIIVARLPKTRSGKVLRATMKAIADGVEYRAPGTIDDPATLGEIEAAFKELQKRQQGKGGKASSAADHAAAVAQKLKL